jgi:hypothetical protein
MKYPFLKNNQLVLVDYLPGSSGQLLLRLWSELDLKLMYDNDALLAKHSITTHPASYEIDYDIIIPKKMTNWFLDNCQFDTVADYMAYFEFLGTTMIALKQKWINQENNIKFYETPSYRLENYRLLYAIHSWERVLPWKDINDYGCNIKVIKIIPQTTEGLRYQKLRYQICCNPASDSWLDAAITDFNSNHSSTDVFDLCTLLVNKDTAAIIDWLSNQLGSDLRHDKISRVHQLLEHYYANIVDKL